MMLEKEIDQIIKSYNKAIIKIDDILKKVKGLSKETILKTIKNLRYEVLPEYNPKEILVEKNFIYQLALLLQKNKKQKFKPFCKVRKYFETENLSDKIIYRYLKELSAHFKEINLEYVIIQ